MQEDGGVNKNIHHVSSSIRKETNQDNNQQPNKAYGVQNHVYDDQIERCLYGVHFEDFGSHRPTLIPPLLFCPENLDLRTELIRNGHRSLVKHLWKLHYIITLLYLHRWNKSSESNEYRPLMAKRLRLVLGSSHTKQVITTLESLNIVEADKKFVYLAGQRSKSYRLCEPYRSAAFRQIKLDELPRFPSSAAIHCRHRIETDGSPQHRHLLNSLKRITLDETSYAFTERSTFSNLGEFDYHLRSAEFIRLGQWFFCYDKHTGRVFNNITNLPKGFRPFLRLDGKSLVELDVVNCQPFLLLDLYSHDEPEREQFAEVVCSGKFYECLDSSLAIPYGDKGRQELKKAVFSQVLFDQVRQTPTKLSLVFRQSFPSLDAKIIKLKTGNHNRLALHLQKLEAEIVIGSAIHQIAMSTKIPALTIHDSVLTLPEYQDEVRELLEQAFTAKFGCVPILRIKHLSHPLPRQTVRPL